MGLYPAWRSEPSKHNDNKGLDALDSLYTLAQKTSALYKQTFDNIRDQADQIVSIIESSIGMINNAISRIETQGYMVSEEFYKEMISNAERQMSERIGERDQLIAQFQKALNDGAVEIYSKEYYDWRKQIDDVTLSIDQLTTSIVEYNDKIRQTRWDNFDLQMSRIGDMATEAQFMIDLMQNETLYNKEGLITNRGISTKGMHGLLYNIYMSEADKFREESLRINEELANDPNNLKLYDRRQQLLEQQREMIRQAEQEKDQLKSLVSEGINKTLEALQKLISEYETALDKQKSLYDFNKNVQSQTKNITDLQKQLASLNGDDSEENRKRLQELNNSLGEAQQTLEETLYERSIQDRKEVLDDMFTKISDVLNARLDNLDVLIAENIGQINLSSGQIADTLKVVAGDVGYVFQNGVQEIFDKADQDLMPALATYTSSYMTTLTNEQAKTNDEITGLKTGVIANITENAGVISGYINSMAAALGLDFQKAHGLIGDSVHGIQITQEKMDLAKKTMSEEILANGGTVEAAITQAKTLMSGELSTVGTNISTFKTDFDTKVTTTNTKLQSVVDNVDTMITDSNQRAKEIMFTINQALDKSDVKVEEGSKKALGNGVYDNVAKIDDIVAYTRATAYNTMIRDVTPTPEVIPEGKITEQKPIINNTGNTGNTGNDIGSKDEGKESNEQKPASTQGDGVPQVDDVITFQGDYYWASNGVRPIGNYFSGEKDAVEIFEISNETEWWHPSHPYHIRKRGTKPGDPYSDLGWVALSQIKGYRFGTSSVDKDRYAMMNEGGKLETIVRPDGSILTPLSRRSMVLNSEATANMWRMLQDPEKFMGSVMENANMETTNNNGNTIENNINITIPISQVNDFNDFMTQVQHSEKFEQMFDLMLNSRLKGSSKFGKFNVRYN